MRYIVKRISSFLEEYKELFSEIYSCVAEERKNFVVRRRSN